MDARDVDVLTHDLANDLTQLVGRLDILAARPDLSPDVRGDIEAAIRGAERAIERLQTFKSAHLT